ncbi:MAG: translation elongation factor Ts [Candidatus Wallbacteria bacterium]|nr:translation elongation factor Ts [Candidatus Wallbacteria bacterium]
MGKAIEANAVKELREKTGVGFMDCKKALVESDGDVEKAIEILRKKGIAKAEKRADRAANEGFVGSYIHLDGKIGVMVEINCETDFVARTDEFRALAKDIAMHIAASNPKFVSSDEIPVDVLEKEKEIFRAQLQDNKKPANIIDKIVEGKITKYFEEICLLEQPFVKEPEKKVKDLIFEKVAKVGENIKIGRFTRIQIGNR